VSVLRLLSEPVREEWIDYNGHLSEPYYVLVFGMATDALYDHLGMDAAYRDDSGCSVFTVESHIRYLREVRLGSELAISTQVLGSDAKRIHFCHEMAVAGEVVATTELMVLHFDQKAGVTSPMPFPVLQRLRELETASPSWIGRRMALPGV
jgi:acyl-CoA thioester hydrolase